MHTHARRCGLELSSTIQIDDGVRMHCLILWLLTGKTGPSAVVCGDGPGLFCSTSGMCLAEPQETTGEEGLGELAVAPVNAHTSLSSFIFPRVKTSLAVHRSMASAVEVMCEYRYS